MPNTPKTLEPYSDIDNDASAVPEDDTTGLPGLRTWRGVYLLVTVIFVAYVVLMTLLTGAFR